MNEGDSIPPTEAVLHSKRLRTLLRYWVGKRGNYAMPSFRQIDPLEIPSLLSIVFVADMTPAGARMRLLGSETTSVYGRETRGQLAGDLQFGEFTPWWHDAFARVAASGAPTTAAGKFYNNTELRNIETILLPLADDRQSVSHILGGLLIKPVPIEVLPTWRTTSFVSARRTDWKRGETGCG